MFKRSFSLMSLAKHPGWIIFCFLTLCIGRSAMSGTQENRPYPRGAVVKTESEEELLSKIWNGVQEAQVKYKTGCGRITEVRTSSLLTKPLVFHGKFCASGMDKFSLEYFEPERIRLVFNRDYLNVTTGKEKRTTEVLRIGGNVARTQQYFSKSNSIKNLKDNFVISVKESPAAYVMRFVPRSRRFSQRVNYVTVTLRKSDFLLSTLEIDGRSGVNSVFTIEIEELNKYIGDGPFEIYRP